MIYIAFLGVFNRIGKINLLSHMQISVRGLLQILKLNQSNKHESIKLMDHESLTT